MRSLGEAQNKVTRAYTQSGQYHTIVESRVHLTWYQSHVLNLVVSIDPRLRGGVLYLREGLINKEYFFHCYDAF